MLPIPMVVPEPMVQSHWKEPEKYSLIVRLVAPVVPPVPQSRAYTGASPKLLSLPGPWQMEQ